MQKLAHEIYSFDEFRLDLTRGSLFRGTLEINLRPKSFELLKYLTENQGRLVSKDELIEAVWNETAVTDDSLVQCLKDIRRALGDDAQQIIKTVPRRGYIFEKEVTSNGAFAYTEESAGVHLVIEESEETNGHGEVIGVKPQLEVGRKSLIGVVRRHKWTTALALTAFVITASGIAYGLFVFLRRPVGSPFKSVNIKRLTTGGNAETVAISPDGKYLAYTIGEDDGRKSLWVRQVVAPNPTQIVESADIVGGTLAFSPDGNFVYYLLKGEGLCQTATFGGSTRKMREGVGGRFAISPDGKQVAWVRLGAGDGLGSRVIVANTDGAGEERILAYRKPPESFTTGGCSWSPDGETLICSAGDNPLFGQQFPMALRVADGRQTPLTPPRWNMAGHTAWLPDGSGFLMRAWEVREASLQFWHVTFPGGVATRIYNDLNDYGALSLTSDSKTFVTIQHKPQLNIYAIELSTEPRQSRQLTFGTDGADGSRCLTTTPDNRIVYYSERSGTGDIWIMDPDGGNQKQLTFDEPLEDGARVSRDGRSVAFGVASQGIWKVDLDGGNRRQLTKYGMFPEYSPDGNWIFYTLPRDKWTMWKVPAEGGEPVRVTDYPAVQPAVSPDGKLIAYMYSKTYSEHKLYVAPVEGGEPIKIFDVLTVNQFDIQWTPDGSSIVYGGSENGVKVLVSQPLEGGEPQILLTAKGEFENIRGWTFSRDGKQLFVSSGPVNQDVVMFSLER